MDQSVEATETQAEVKAEPEKDSFAKFRKPDGSIDADKLSKSYSQLEKAYHKRPQAPAASVEEYSFDFGEGFQVDEERTNAFKEAALAKGVTKEQYVWLMETYSKNLPGQSELSGTWTVENTQKALESEWGADFEHNAVIARKAFDTFAPSDADLSDPVWNHPAVMKLLARMGGELAEDSIAKRPSQAAGESVRQQIDALRAEPDYMSNPAKQAQMLKLYEKLG
ncbi:MAG: hypothetical protein Q7V53_07190 [Caldisericota bacterium]|nr:hypothetical protein [Caldisericota bacterium]